MKAADRTASEAVLQDGKGVEGDPAESNGRVADGPLLGTDDCGQNIQQLSSTKIYNLEAMQEIETSNQCDPRYVLQQANRSLDSTAEVTNDVETGDGVHKELLQADGLCQSAAIYTVEEATTVHETSFPAKVLPRASSSLETAAATSADHDLGTTVLWTTPTAPLTSSEELRRRPGACRIYPSGYVMSSEPTGTQDDIIHTGIPVVSASSRLSPSNFDNHDDPSTTVFAMGVVVDEEMERAREMVAPATVQAKVAKGFYVKRRRLLVFSAALLGMIGVVCLAIGLATRPKKSQQQTPEEPSITLPTTMEKLANSLPSYTVATLQNDLTNVAKDTKWYEHPSWKAEVHFEPQSPQGQAWQWLLSHPDLKSRGLRDITERFALATLYYATDGPNWKNSTNWLSTTVDVCRWWSTAADGPKIDYQTILDMCFGRLATNGPGIQHLYLEANGLSGTLPPELGLLSSISYIKLASNILHGRIHDDVWISWQNAVNIIIDGNSFTGSLPTMLGLYSQIGYLSAMYNLFSGSLPTEVANLSSLRWLWLPGNALTGGLPQLGRLRFLSELVLSDNCLSGDIPSELGRDLVRLELANNQFSGAIPSTIASCRLLSSLDLSFNPLLEGSIPTQLARLTDLKMLYLANTSVTGKLPSTLARLTDLIRIDVSGTRLDGTVASEFGQLAQLTDLRIFDSSMSGTIPASVCNAFTAQSANAGLAVDCDRVTCSCNCSCA